MGTTRTPRPCPHCRQKYARLDRHLTGRGHCGVLEDRRRAAAAEQVAQPSAEQPSSPVAARTAPPAPAGLQAPGRALWEAVTGSYAVEAHLRPVLEAAALELDRAAAAEQAVTEAGEWQIDRYGGLKPHPGIGVARSSRLAAARLLKALNIPEEEE
jgi:hypothetical protein